MQHNHMIFGIDRRGSALVVSFMQKWSHREQPVGSPNHLPLEMLSSKGRQYVCRALGEMTLGVLAIHHPDAMQPYDGFKHISPAPLYDPQSNVAHLVPDLGAVLPICVAIGVSDDSASLEFAEYDDAQRALPGTVRSRSFGELAALEPNAAAEIIGSDVLATLTRLYPAVLVYLDTPEVAERARLLQEEKHKMGKLLDDMAKGLKPDDG